MERDHLCSGIRGEWDLRLCLPGDKWCGSPVIAYTSGLSGFRCHCTSGLPGSAEAVLPGSIINKFAVIGEKWRESRSGALGFLFYANGEPQPNAKYSCAASVAIGR